MCVGWLGESSIDVFDVVLVVVLIVGLEVLVMRAPAMWFEATSSRQRSLGFEGHGMMCFKRRRCWRARCKPRSAGHGVVSLQSGASVLFRWSLGGARSLPGPILPVDTTPAPDDDAQWWGADEVRWAIPTTVRGSAPGHVAQAENSAVPVTVETRGSPVAKRCHASAA